MVGLGLGLIFTAVPVAADPLLVGTLLAASRRRRAVAASFAIAASAFILPWCVPLATDRAMSTSAEIR